MTTKLYTIEENGVEREINVQGQVLELNPSDNPPSEHYLQAMNGLKDAELSCVVSCDAETYKFLHKQYVMALALRAAIWKLRKTCSNCRFMLCLQRKHGHIWLCRFSRKRISMGIYELHAMTCPYFRRKCKSKP